MIPTFHTVPKLTILPRIIEYINKHEGVEWMPMCEMAKEFVEGRISGVEVEGGVEL
jgi:hypothetical protein